DRTDSSRFLASCPRIGFSRLLVSDAPGGLRNQGDGSFALLADAARAVLHFLAGLVDDAALPSRTGGHEDPRSFQTWRLLGHSRISDAGRSGDSESGPQ